MTLTAIPPRLVEDGSPHADFVTDLIDVATYFAVHVDIPLPVRHLNIPVPPGPPGERLAELRKIAGELAVDVTERDGMLIAERQFGAPAVEAHLSIRDASSGPRHARQAGSAVAA